MLGKSIILVQVFAIMVYFQISFYKLQTDNYNLLLSTIMPIITSLYLKPQTYSVACFIATNSLTSPFAILPLWRLCSVSCRSAVHCYTFQFSTFFHSRHLSNFRHSCLNKMTYSSAVIYIWEKIPNASLNQTITSPDLQTNS